MLFLHLQVSAAALLQGFVECLDSNTAEEDQDVASALLNQEGEAEQPQLQNALCM